MKFTLKIKENKTFRKVLKKGKYGVAEHLAIHCLKMSENTNYFGVCVSKKNGISVHRNKLKRWARESYKIQEDKLKKGYYIIVMYKKTTIIDNISFKVVNEEICKCFKDLDLYE